MADDEKPKPDSPGGETTDGASAPGAPSEKRAIDDDRPAGWGGLDLQEPDVPGISAAGSPRSDRAETPPQIGGYEILGRLGEGGQGTVWRAVQVSTKRQVALKMLGRGMFTTSKARARFEREVELAARLRHPNIAEVFESGVHRGVYYYAMALVDGADLDEYVTRNDLGQRQIIELVQTVCRAVQHAHQRQVIHRDLKPANILVTEDGQPCVVDFGLAKGILGDEREMTLSFDGHFMGTAHYCSPEQAAGRHSEIDTRTDIYTLGVILYRLLTGHWPHDPAGTVSEVLGRIEREDVRRPREISRAVDRDLEAVLLKALARNQDDRYASAAEMAQDLRSYLNGEEVAARAPMMLDHLRRAIARYPVALAIGLTLVALLIGVVVVGAIRIDEEHRAWEETRKELYAARFALSRKAYKQGDFREAIKQLLSCPEEYRDREWNRLRYDIRFALAEEAYKRGDLLDADRQLRYCPEEFRDERWRQLRLLVPE